MHLRKGLTQLFIPFYLLLPFRITKITLVFKLIVRINRDPVHIPGIIRDANTYKIPASRLNTIGFCL